MNSQSFILAIAILFGSAFLFTQMLHSANVDIVISEIGAYESSGHEWIEITNTGNDPIDIDGWKFVENDTNHGLTLVQGDDTIIDPGEFVIITQNDANFILDYPDVTSTIFDSSWGTLNEGGEELALRDADGEIVEVFTYISAADFSLERIDLEEKIYDDTNWKEHPDGNTVGQQNYWFEEDLAPQVIEETTTTTPETTTTTPETSEEVASTTISLVINEFLPNPSDGEEWIELYNTGTTTITLDGMTLADGVGTIASPTGTVAADAFVVIELTSSKLNNNGDILSLLDSSGSVIDNIAYGNWEGATVAEPEKGNTLAREGNNFFETTSITKGGANIITSTEIEETSQNNSGGGAQTLLVDFQKSDVVINEIVSDPADDENEFVELFNRTRNTIDLQGWWFEDGGESKTPLVGTIEQNGFVVIEGIKGNLNNSGDRIVLFDPNGKEIDSLTYGSWDDGNLNDNASAAKDPQSIARNIDGQDSDTDQYDFSLTDTITKGMWNIISLQSESGESIVQAPITDNIRITEVYPNPPGSDSEEEFIELYNYGKQTIDLVEWKLRDATSRKYTISQGRVAPGEYIIIKRSVSRIALNNTGGEEVHLLDPSDREVDSMSYSGSAGEAESYARRDDGSWAWTTTVTPEQQNNITGKSQSPVIAIDVDTEVAVHEPILFDASDTTHPDGAQMTFTWDFDDGMSDEGDVVEHVFREEGLFTVELTVADSFGNIASQKVIITVKHPRSFTGGYTQIDPVESIIISEFVPNPEGSDTTEFIELFNPIAEDIDLSGMKLDDEEGGSRAFTIPSNTILSAGEYIVFPRQDTKLALNNTSDAVRFMYPDGSIIHDIRYDEVEEGASYLQNEDHTWVWSSSPTPGKENVISPIVQKSVRRVSRRSSRRVKPLIHTTLDKIRDEDIGDRVMVTGTVAVAPGVFGSQYFYIVGSPGVQVYLHNKDFPTLAIGDVVQVTGELSSVGGETRLKAKEKSDIVVLDHTGIPSSLPLDIEQVGEQYEGWLTKVHGEITEIKTSYMYVDDGTEEVKVYFKRNAGINRKLFQVGDLVTVTGIISQTKTGYRLLPRAQEDIIKTGVAKIAVEYKTAAEKEQAEDIAEKYLTATAGGITSILLGLFARGRGAAARTVAKRVMQVGLFIVRRRK